MKIIKRTKKNYRRPVKPHRMQTNVENARYVLAEILARLSWESHEPCILTIKVWSWYISGCQF